MDADVAKLTAHALARETQHRQVPKLEPESQAAGGKRKRGRPRKATSSVHSPQIQEKIDPESLQRLQNMIRVLSEPEQREIIETLVTCQHKPECHIFKLQARGRQSCISVSAFLKDWASMKAAERTSGETQVTSLLSCEESLHRDELALAITMREQPSTLAITKGENREITTEEMISKQNQQFNHLATLLSQIVATQKEALDSSCLSQARTDAVKSMSNAKTLLASRHMTAVWAQSLDSEDVALSSVITQTVKAHIDEASADLNKQQKILDDIDANLAERRNALDAFKKGLDVAVRTTLDL